AEGRGRRQRGPRLHVARPAGAAAHLPGRRAARAHRAPDARDAGHAGRRVPGAHRQGAARLTMLAIFGNDLRIFLRDRWALVFSLVMPVVVITVIAQALLGRHGPRLLVPVVDEDGGPVARSFMKLLGEHADVREMSRAEAMKFVGVTNSAAAAIVFPPHLSKQYLQGKSSELLLITDPASGAELQATKM